MLYLYIFNDIKDLLVITAKYKVLNKAIAIEKLKLNINDLFHV